MSGFTTVPDTGNIRAPMKKGDPEDFLPAEMEHTPTRAPAYFTTALYYEDASDLPRAVCRLPARAGPDPGPH